MPNELSSSGELSIPKEFKGNLKWNSFLKKNKGKIKRSDRPSMWASERRKISWCSLANRKHWKSLDYGYIRFESQFLKERWNIKEGVCYELASQRDNNVLISPSRNMSDRRFKINSRRISEVPTMKCSQNLNQFVFNKYISFWDNSEDKEEKYNNCKANLNLTIGDILPIE